LRHSADDNLSFAAQEASQIISQPTKSAVFNVPEASGMVQNRAYNGLNQNASIALINDGTRTLTYEVYNRLIRAQKTGLDTRNDNSDHSVVHNDIKAHSSNFYRKWQPATPRR
jgi:hypothetical protein